MLFYIQLCYSFYLRHFSKGYLTVEGNKLTLTNHRNLASEFCFDQDSYFNEFQIKTTGRLFLTKENNELALSARTDRSNQKFRLILDSTGRFLLSQNKFIAIYNKVRERFSFIKDTNTDTNGFSIEGDTGLLDSPVENKFIQLVDFYVKESQPKKYKPMVKTHKYRLLQFLIKKKKSFLQRLKSLINK